MDADRIFQTSQTAARIQWSASSGCVSPYSGAPPDIRRDAVLSEIEMRRIAPSELIVWLSVCEPVKADFESFHSDSVTRPGGLWKIGCQTGPHFFIQRITEDK